ncbi:MAG: hypothetical protein N4A38_04205 [Candidatus Gracilibacteria bacterium]|nr:hypothetical protein [Candidatus Gracilibacteria bacterium]
MTAEQQKTIENNDLVTSLSDTQVNNDPADPKYTNTSREKETLVTMVNATNPEGPNKFEQIAHANFEQEMDNLGKKLEKIQVLIEDAKKFNGIAKLEALYKAEEQIADMRDTISNMPSTLTNDNTNNIGGELDFFEGDIAALKAPIEKQIHEIADLQIELTKAMEKGEDFMPFFNKIQALSREYGIDPKSKDVEMKIVELEQTGFNPSTAENTKGGYVEKEEQTDKEKFDAEMAERSKNGTKGISLKDMPKEEQEWANEDTLVKNIDDDIKKYVENGQPDVAINYVKSLNLSHRIMEKLGDMEGYQELIDKDYNISKVQYMRGLGFELELYANKTDSKGLNLFIQNNKKQLEAWIPTDEEQLKYANAVNLSKEARKIFGIPEQEKNS